MLAVAPWVDQVFYASEFAKPVEGAWVVVVEETSDRNPAVVRVLADGEFWLSLEKRKTNWRLYDIDSEDAKPFRKTAEDVGVPAVLIVDPNGNILKASPLPATTNGISELLKEATGQ